MHFCDGATDIEANAHSFRLRGEERFEELRLHVSRNARTVVRNLECYLMLSLKGLYGKRDLVVLAGFRGFHGILQQIEKQLLDHHGVAHDAAHIRRNIKLHRGVPLFRLNQRKLHRFINQLLNRRGCHFRRGTLRE